MTYKEWYEWYELYGKDYKTKQDEILKKKKEREKDKKKREKEKTKKQQEKELQKNKSDDIIIKNSDIPNNNSIKDFTMERRKNNTGEFKDFKVPLQKKAVLNIAKKYNIDLKDINLKIQRNKDLINLPLAGSTDYKNIGRIDLFPNAFINEEQLVRTLVHEKCHVEQLRKYGVDYTQKNLVEMERMAYKYEDEWYNNIKKEMKL